MGGNGTVGRREPYVARGALWARAPAQARCVPIADECSLPPARRRGVATGWREKGELLKMHLLGYVLHCVLLVHVALRQVSAGRA